MSPKVQNNMSTNYCCVRACNYSKFGFIELLFAVTEQAATEL